jgi:predicted transcriptional regulator
MPSTLKVDAVMQSPVKTLPADMSTVDALQFAERYHMHHLPLLDGGKIVGLVCTCDLEDLELTAPIRNAVSHPLATIPPQSGIDQAVLRMSERSVGSLLVVDDGALVGIVTREDLARAGAEVDNVPHFRCRSCGSIRHLKREGDKGTLCMDCRARAAPEEPGDGTGVGD